MNNLLKNLNQRQQEAVIHKEGPAIVLAGAGSGKTKVLTTRAAWLLEEKKVSPESILLVTFTNKAANEMNKRLHAQTGYKLPFSGTFHSLCARLLRKDGALIGLDPNYTIYDSNDQLALMKQIYKKRGWSVKEFNPKTIKSKISSAKNNGIGPSEYESLSSGYFDQFVAEAYVAYNQALRENQAVDFDDLLLLTVKLLKSYKPVLSKYQDLISHVLVDEYQDTNTVQYQLTKLFTKPQDNVFVVGDFAQSIYAWRGANYRNMMQLKKDFDNVTEYRLEQNYRSTQTILDAATSIISKATEHPILELWTEQTHQSKLVCLETRSSDDEAIQVLKIISQDLSAYSYNDIAILYRTNAQSRSFEEAFMRQGIPYKLVGGFKFYERKEVKDVLSYLSLIVNPANNVARERASKLGKRSLNKLDKWVEEQKEKTPSLLEKNPADLLQEILDITKYQDKYDPEDPEDVSRLENIQELLNVAKQFQDIVTFLENIALVQDNYMHDLDQNEEKQSITLMSLHSAKGLEFPVVFMVGMEDGLLPHSRSLFDKSQLEEERRLCYVGITRAKERLFFTFAHKRWQHGSSSYSLRSRFLQDIPTELIEMRLNAAPAQEYKKDLNYYQNQALNLDKKKPTSTTRRLVIDDDMLDAVLNDEIDLDKFLDR